MLAEAQKSLDYTRSEGGRSEARRKCQTQLAGSATGAGTADPSQLCQIPDNPEEYEIKNADTRRAQAEVSLSKVRADLQSVSLRLEQIALNDAKMEERKKAVRRIAGRLSGDKSFDSCLAVS